jgi:hypothetical protein
MSRRVLIILILASLKIQNAMAIIGGERARSGEFTSSMSLARNGNHFCSAILIAPNKIATARHCLENSGAVPFELEGSWGVDRQHQQTIHITNIEQSTNELADWAVLEIQENNLPELTVQNILGSYDPALPLTITGYGCADMLGHPGGDHLRLARARRPYPMGDKINFSSTPESGLYPSLCPGDSGGGAYQQRPNGEWVLVGVNSAIGHLQGDFSSGTSKIQMLPEQLLANKENCPQAAPLNPTNQLSNLLGRLLPSLETLL